MSKVEFSAGRFKVECWTDGYPLRTELTDIYDEDAKIRVEGRELKDLMHILDRMRNAMKAHYLRPGFGMQNDALELE